ncbi:TPA: tetratricopeptide repeat protein [bacterium]|nr:tetratricopeptide repeat protein [bacterium]
MKRSLSFILLIIGIVTFSVAMNGVSAVPDRDYTIAVTLLNEDEYEAAENKFTTIIQNNDINDEKSAPYIVNSYYGRASSRIELGRRLRLNKKSTDAIEKYNQAYSDLFMFKTKFEEMKGKLRLNATLYEEMEKHFMVISEQMVQLSGEAGDIAFSQGEYSKAVEWYDNGLQFISTRAPEYAKLLYAKADATFQMGRYQEALRLLSKFETELSNSELSDKALFYAGDIYKMMAETAEKEADKINFLQKAVEVYTRVIANPREYVTDVATLELPKIALLERARCQKQLGQMDKALADFRLIIERYPNSRYEVDALMEIGDYAFNARQYSAAIENFDKALKVSRSIGKVELMAVAYYWLGWSYFAEASTIDTQNSPELVKRANNLYGQSVEAFANSNDNVGKYWKKEGKETQMAKELDGYYGESQYMIGRGYQRLGRWDDAIRTFEGINISYQKWRFRGLAEIALSKERKGDINGSIATWDQLKRELSLTRIPDIEQELLMRRAGSLFDLKRYEEAEKAYTEIITRYPDTANEPEAILNLGLSLFKQNRNKEAIEQFNVLIKKYGSNSDLDQFVGDALFWRGYLLARSGAGDQDTELNLRQALLDYKELVRRFPNSPRADDAQFEIGFCTYSLGSSDPKKYAQAIDEYTKVLVNYPQSEYADDAVYEIARCYRLMNDRVNEEKSLELMVQTYPNSELADNAMLRIAEIYYERAQQSSNRELKLSAENAYRDIIAKYPGTESEAIAHFQMGSIMFKFDKSYQRSADEFASSARVIESIINKVIAGQYTPPDLDIAIISNLFLRSTFWQAESLFQQAKLKQLQGQDTEIGLVKQAFTQARGVYEQVLSRGTKLRSSFPDKTQNILDIMDGEKLEIPIIAESQFMISRCLYEEGDQSSAKLKLQEVQNITSLKPKIDYLSALIAYKQGNLLDAKNFAEKWLDNESLKKMPDEYAVGLQNIIAKIILDSGNPSGARTNALDTWALFQSTNGLWEESAEIVAESYFQQKDMEKAKSWYNRLVNSQFEYWRRVGRNGITKIAGPSNEGK